MLCVSWYVQYVLSFYYFSVILEMFWLLFLTGWTATFSSLACNVAAVYVSITAIENIAADQQNIAAQQQQ